MRVLLKNKQYITDVHFWGLTDNQSWFNKWPINPRVDYPTLFDRNNTPKAAYYDLLRMAPNQPPAGASICSFLIALCVQAH
jgi:endo-1,4-beta-xylanase